MKSALFIHRSVGQNLVNKGRLYELLAKTCPDLSFNDYNQNSDTLSDGTLQKKCGFSFPGGNTRPQDYAEIFKLVVDKHHKSIHDMALSHDLIVLKSCFPNSNIKSNQQLEQMKSYYERIADFFAQHPKKQLILLTSPPLVPILTTPARAKRARLLSSWLASTKFADNVRVFNFYDLLADPKKNWLRRAYRRWMPFDAHPNTKASNAIAPLLTDFIKQTVSN